MPTDLYSPIHKRIPLAQAQAGIEMYIDHMSAGKILLVADQREVTLDEAANGAGEIGLEDGVGRGVVGLGIS